MDPPLHNKRHFKDMGEPEIEAFLTHLAVEGNVAASTQNQKYTVAPVDTLPKLLHTIVVWGEFRRRSTSLGFCSK